VGKIEEDIVEIKTDLKWIKQTLETHISHHWQIKTLAIAAVAGGIVSLLIGIFH
jgi:hypothetical protein